MNEQDIRNIVKQEVQANETARRFQLSGIPRHTHNNNDAPLVFQAVLTYVGTVLQGTFGSLIQPTGLLLPQGWTISYQSDGAGGYFQVYQVTHNLNSNYYSVAVTPLENNPSSPTFNVANIQVNPSNFLVYFFVSNTTTVSDCGFTFALTDTSNKLSILPSYNYTGS